MGQTLHWITELPINHYQPAANIGRLYIHHVSGTLRWRPKHWLGLALGFLVPWMLARDSQLFAEVGVGKRLLKLDIIIMILSWTGFHGLWCSPIDKGQYCIIPTIIKQKRVNISIPAIVGFYQHVSLVAFLPDLGGLSPHYFIGLCWYVSISVACQLRFTKFY